MLAENLVPVEDWFSPPRMNRVLRPPVFYLERVVQTFPSTRHAEAAQVRLSQIQGQPTRADYKK